MRHIFLTQPAVVSPRWHEAFPSAQILAQLDGLPAKLAGVTLWVHLPTPDLLHHLPLWLKAEARIVVLAAVEDPAQAKLVIEQGASGYLHYLAATTLLKQVHQVVRVGGLWLGADLMRQLVFGAATILKPTLTAPGLDSLTLREKSVAEAVASGKANKEIARDLDITERTVKAHLSAVFEKLQVRDRLQLVLVMSGRQSGQTP